MVIIYQAIFAFLAEFMSAQLEIGCRLKRTVLLKQKHTDFTAMQEIHAILIRLFIDNPFTG